VGTLSWGVVDVSIVSISERPEFGDSLGVSWPSFIKHDPVAAALMPVVQRLFADFDLVLLDKDEVVVAGAWGVPLRWDGTIADLPRGWDGALERAVSDYEAGVAPTTLCAMASEVAVEHQRKGLAGQALRALRARANERELSRMIAPVRPTQKHLYPLIPIEQYASWTRPDGSPFDPWLRTHVRLGARMLAPAAHGMEIVGSIAEWEEWTELLLPGDGEFVVPNALAPISVDHENDHVRYVEPAVWVLHET
jgi:hypothetical protein